ncbi:MAG: M48 family metalloprotease [Candidatus Omnitrophica bacterium]|nr:M48 family metalloprotease [Candidatus Omnitrophota bacterium]
MTGQRKKSSHFIFVLILSLVFSGCVRDRAVKKSQITTKIPREISEEIEIGEKIHAEILSNFYTYTDPLVVAYVQQIGQALARQAKRQEIPYRFTVLYHDNVYATSAPGGHVYITTGFLNMLDNEAELAGVIAHEVGELQFRDPQLSQARKALQAVSQAGAVVGPLLGEIGALAMLGLTLVHAAVAVNQMTPEERVMKSDAYALQYMTEADFDPQGLVDVLYKFLHTETEMTPYFYDYYQIRPITENRFEKMKDAFSKLPLEGRTFRTNREIYQDATKGIREIYAT